MRKKSLITILVCISMTSFGQRGLGFTFYQNTDIFRVQTIVLPSHEVTRQTQVNFSRISLAVELMTKKNNVHEIEFFLPEVDKPFDRFDFPAQYYTWSHNKTERVATSYSFRYGFSKYLPSKSDRLNFLIGAGINPYYVLQEFIPHTNATYYNSIKWIGAALDVTPGIRFKLGKHFRLGFSMPFGIYNFRFQEYRQDNPILPVRQQRNKETKHLFCQPVFTFRLGVTYDLNK